MLLGQAPTATRLTLDITGSQGSVGLRELQANWEAQLGLALLEEGVIRDELDARGLILREGAETHLKRVLEIDETHPLKPLVEYYLDQISLTVTDFGEQPPAC